MLKSFHTKQLKNSHWSLQHDRGCKYEKESHIFPKIHPATNVKLGSVLSIWISRTVLIPFIDFMIITDTNFFVRECFCNCTIAVDFSSIIKINNYNVIESGKYWNILWLKLSPSSNTTNGKLFSLKSKYNLKILEKERIPFNRLCLEYCSIECWLVSWPE